MKKGHDIFGPNGYYDHSGNKCKQKIDWVGQAWLGTMSAVSAAQ